MYLNYAYMNYFPGFTGVNCEIAVDHCSSNLCENNATCRNVGATFECSCATGFEGHNCSKNVDDCLSANCQNNATCKDGINEYKCICGPGFTGTLCENDVNECLSPPCQNKGLEDHNCGNNVDIKMWVIIICIIIFIRVN